MKKHDADPTKPTPYDIAAYVTHLGASYTSHTTVLNYMCGAKHWVLTKGGLVDPFNHHQVTMTKAGVLKSSTHVPRRAPPMTPQQLKKVCRYFDQGGAAGSICKAAWLFGYFTLVRQSNLVHTSTAWSGGRHTILRRDVSISPQGLVVTLRSTKTISAAKDATSILVPYATDPRFCPVRAWKKYLKVASPPPEGPAFILRSGDPLTTKTLTNAIRLAIRASGLPGADSFTLHSLRRGGAQACAQAGASLPQIQALGTWSGPAVHTYVPRTLIKQAPAALVKLFA